MQNKTIDFSGNGGGASYAESVMSTSIRDWLPMSRTRIAQSSLEQFSARIKSSREDEHNKTALQLTSNKQ